MAAVSEEEKKALDALVKLLENPDAGIRLDAARAILIDRPHALQVSSA